MKSWPYCQHPECHNRHTSDYSYAPVTSGNGMMPSPRKRQSWFGGSDPRSQGPGVRRWCHTHALLNEGWAVGSAS